MPVKYEICFYDQERDEEWEREGSGGKEHGRAVRLGEDQMGRPWWLGY